MTADLLKRLRSLFGIGTCRAGDSALDAMVIGLTQTRLLYSMWSIDRRQSNTDAPFHR